MQPVVYVAALCLGTRGSILLFEAFSEVSNERSLDQDLIKACEDRIADSSPKMRTACIQARSEQAAPLVLKALVRACCNAYQDLQYIFSRWVIWCALLALLGAGIAYRQISLRRGRSVLFEDIDQSNSHVVLVGDLLSSLGQRRSIGSNIAHRLEWGVDKKA